MHADRPYVPSQFDRPVFFGNLMQVKTRCHIPSHLDEFYQHTVWMAAELKTLAEEQTKLTISCVQLITFIAIML